MEKKKFMLSLNKETVAKLNETDMGSLLGGNDTAKPTDLVSGCATVCPKPVWSCHTFCYYTCGCVNTESNCC